MGECWQVDKRWSDRFLPHIKRILGEVLICEPPIEEDQERNTDLIVLKMDSVRVGCRIRRKEYAEKYPDEFTIRFGRPSGVKTELSKIVEGWGDYFFYGFEGDGDLLSVWGLGNLNVFRLWFNREIVKNKGVLPGIFKKNFDGSSDFLVFKWAELPVDFVVKRGNN